MDKGRVAHDVTEKALQREKLEPIFKNGLTPSWASTCTALKLDMQDLPCSFSGKAPKSHPPQA